MVCFNYPKHCNVLQTPACPAFGPVQLYCADACAGGHPVTLQTATEPQRGGTRVVRLDSSVCELKVMEHMLAQNILG